MKKLLNKSERILLIALVGKSLLTPRFETRNLKESRKAIMKTYPDRKVCPETEFYYKVQGLTYATYALCIIITAMLIVAAIVVYG